MDLGIGTALGDDLNVGAGLFELIEAPVQLLALRECHICQYSVLYDKYSNRKYDSESRFHKLFRSPNSWNSAPSSCTGVNGRYLFVGLGIEMLCRAISN